MVGEPGQREQFDFLLLRAVRQLLQFADPLLLTFLDAMGVEKRRRSRSKYGVKRPKDTGAKKDAGAKAA